MKVYGPYTRKKDGRQHVILYQDGKRRTMSYPKYIYWIKKGILIKDKEHIHHKDNNIANNVVNNYEVKTRYNHMTTHAKKETLVCKWCNQSFEVSGRALSNRKTSRKRGKAGPFCSRQCIGKYGATKAPVVKVVDT